MKSFINKRWTIVVILFSCLGSETVFADNCNNKFYSWLNFYDTCLDTPSKVKVNVSLAVNFIISKTNDSGVYPSRFHITDLFEKIKQSQVKVEKACDLVKIYNNDSSATPAVYNEWFDYFKCDQDKSPKPESSLVETENNNAPTSPVEKNKNNPTNKNNVNQQLPWLLTILTLIITFLIVTAYHWWFVRQMEQNLRQEIALNKKRIRYLSTKIRALSTKAKEKTLVPKTQKVANKNLAIVDSNSEPQKKPFPPIQIKETEDKQKQDQSLKESLALNAIFNQLLDISNITEGKNLIETAKLTIPSLNQAIFGIPIYEDREQRKFRFDIQENVTNMADIYTIITLKHGEDITNLLIPCDIEGRVPSLLLKSFYTVDANTTAIRKQNSYAATEIILETKKNYKQEDIIYFTINQMGQLT